MKTGCYEYFGVIPHAVFNRLELSKAELEQGKFILAEEDLETQEERLEQERSENVMQRARKENIKVVQADRRRRNRERRVQTNKQTNEQTNWQTVDRQIEHFHAAAIFV